MIKTEIVDVEMTEVKPEFAFVKRKTTSTVKVS